MKERVILVIRDGWGYRKSKNGNFLYQVDTPNTDSIMKNYPNVLLDAAGEDVGLPDGYQGNSEVGHMTIGSGRIMFQAMAKVHKAIETGDFFKIKEFHAAINNCKKNKSTLHIIGLLQTEGVHAHLDHLFALLDLCKKEKFHDVVIHAITDGRDSPVTNSLKNVAALEKKFKKIGFGKIATISGRYYSMDRDKRWDRTKLTYDCIVDGICKESFKDVVKTLKAAHAAKEFDEFIIPRKLEGYSGVKDNDSIIFYNFRTDRTRQLTQALVEDNFDGWQRQKKKIVYVAMTQYYNPMNALVAFKDENVSNLLGGVVAKAGLKQLRITETEKYAHVTYFFNGQIEEPNKNEDRILIPSQKVATYDLKPEMSIYGITDKLIEEINSKKYDMIVTNLVNADMVGHTGVAEAIKKAVAAVDECLGKIVKSGLDNNYTLLVFADHGNVEDKSPKWMTSHTTNPIPFIVVSNNEKLKKCKLKEHKGLQDIAPTVIELMGLKKPKEMTGESLIKK
ncbi:MAG TPA: 2,3-bisphosphoglycerate-independent phosphoglycerate mutase [Alphaproteobacteria bacterium]|nr:2,3-bisphosphoglycerate-independent phosphoglycerate mutase [Alphaproteobacteria bacterium]